MGNHTIILFQTTTAPASRTWYDHGSVEEAMEGIVLMFERSLKELHPSSATLQYNPDNVKEYVDKMENISALVFDQDIKAYIPCTQEWVKRMLFEHLRKSAHEALDRRD